MRKVTVTKIDAARRHLRLAIKLWFADGDPVPMHTLARAAYQVIHDLNTRNKGPELLFDTSQIKQEFRGHFRKLMKEASDFMKHADRGRVGLMTEVTLDTELTRAFITFSTVGLKHLGEKLGPEEITFTVWQGFHKPELLSDFGKDFFNGLLNAEDEVRLRAMSKSEFFEYVLGILRQTLGTHDTPPNATGD